MLIRNKNIKLIQKFEIILVLICILNVFGSSPLVSQVGATSDTTQPVLHSLSLSQTNITTNQYITVIANVSDDIYSISYVVIFVVGPGPTGLDRLNMSLTFNSSSQVYQGNIYFNSYWPDGYYYISYVNILDNRSYGFFYYNGIDYANQSFYVYGGTPDITPPVLHSLSFSHSIIFLNQTVVVSANITDDLSGVMYARISIYDPTNVRRFKIYLSFNSTTQLYQTTISMNQNFLYGRYYIERVVLCDQAGNYARIYNSTDYISPTLIYTPLVTQLKNYSYIVGSSGHFLSWHLNSETSQGNYSLYKNGNLLNSSSWSGINTLVTENIDNLNPGTYNYTICVNDSSGIKATDTVIVTVLPIPVPSVNQPANIIYEVNSTGNEIYWTPSGWNSSIFNIFKDGILVSTGYWKSNQPLSKSIDNLPIGMYNYTIQLNNTYGISVSNTVYVNVTAISTMQTTNYGQSITTFGQIITTAPGFEIPSIIFLLGIILIVKRRLKKN